jgi:hypothetical protein
VTEDEDVKGADHPTRAFRDHQVMVAGTSDAPEARAHLPCAPSVLLVLISLEFAIERIDRIEVPFARPLNPNLGRSPGAPEYSCFIGPTRIF